jgi:phosphoglucosamine mutase
MGRLFGTDGVRGIANSELTPEMAFKIGQAGAFVLTEENKHKAKILVGKDTRISGDLLESAIISGICSVGAEAIIVGIIPTPAVAYLTRAYGADAGIVISASHNPVEYNGIKFFNSKGYKLRDEIENRIEDIILDGKEKMVLPTGKEVGFKSVIKNAKEQYINFAINTIDTNLEGLKIAIDCANGASYKVAKEALVKLGAVVYSTSDKPDGCNINFKCGSTYLDNIKRLVKKTGADLGLAFDGDADRVLAVDEKGNDVDGDKIMSICANFLRKRKQLRENTLVVTVMSNLGLFLMGKEKGINIKTTKVGDRYVLEEMLEGNYTIGGEQSGHIIFLKHNTTGDGLITALQLLSVIKSENKKLSELSGIMQVFPQVLVNAKVNNGNKYSYAQDGEIQRSIKEIEDIFKDEGRVLIRPSGTEPLVRVMIEGREPDFIYEKANALAKLIETKMG